MTDLCERHAAQWDAWSDYKLVHPFRINGSASYDDSLRGVLQRRQRLVAEWRATIRYQQQLIRRICAAKCQPAVDAQVAA
jgi:hypothetical protein